MKRILALLLFLSPAVQAIVIDNGIPAGTEGHFSVDVDVDVDAGGDTSNATITAVRSDSEEIVTTDVVANYISFVDPGQDGGGIGLSRSENVVGPTADPNVPNTVTSSGTFSGQFGEVSWNATSSISPGSQLMTTRYVFFTTGADPIGLLRVLQYLDEDVNPDADGSFADNVFLSRGSADSGDLSLYTFGNLEVIGVRQAGSEPFESFFAGWAAAPFRQILDRILGAGQPIALEGVIDLPTIDHPQLGPARGPADITSVLAWDINPTTFLADVVTVLGGEDAAPVPDPDPLPDTPAADLSIIMSGTPNPATAHQPLIYTLTVENNGPDPATSVGVTDLLPSDVAFVRATGDCSGFPTLTCRLGTLLNRASAGVTIEVIPREAGAVMNRATVYLNSTNGIDSRPDNNEAIATIPVNPAPVPKADLRLTMADSPDPGAVGERLTYTLTVTNNGPDTATSVQVTDSLPLAVEIGAPTGNCRGNRVVVCDLGTLVSGASAIVPIEVIPTVAGAVTNEVVVNSNVSDPVPGNNTVSASTSVNPSALVLPPQGRQNTCTGRQCKVRLTCALGTTCTNRVTLFAQGPSGRLASDSSAKAARMIPFAFASVTNVPSGQTLNVRLTFTKRGRQIVSQLLKNGTRRFNGRIAISRSFRGGVSSLPATVRLRSKR